MGKMILLIFLASSIHADEGKSVQPYIDQLKSGFPAQEVLRPTVEVPDPYLQGIKLGLPAAETESAAAASLRR